MDLPHILYLYCTNPLTQNTRNGSSSCTVPYCNVLTHSMSTVLKYKTFFQSHFVQQIDAIRGTSPNNSAVTPSPIIQHIFSNFMKRLHMLAKLLFFGIACLQNVISNYDSKHETALIISYYPSIHTYSTSWKQRLNTRSYTH